MSLKTRVTTLERATSATKIPDGPGLTPEMQAILDALIARDPGVSLLLDQLEAKMNQFENIPR